MVERQLNMSLNIKDQEAHLLAQSLAKETGETMTKAVKIALKERLERVRDRRKRKKNLAKELLDIGESFSKRMKGPPIDHAEFLYDEHGLPK
ncbi:MAG TPA: type II toxin-antitoxin system VapB family antitoxin [Candidatus Acidoferrum sp.]|nr:type II toxin-antitoxin system VapB family antitoxin [Candidatus Acidoferrum sp.]